MSSVKLDTVKSSLVKIFSRVSKTIDDVGNVFLCRGTGLCECDAHMVAVELHIAGTDWMRLEIFGSLTTRMSNLSNYETPLGLSSCCEFLKTFETLTRELCMLRN